MSPGINYKLIDRRQGDRRKKTEIDIEIDRRNQLRRSSEGVSPLARYRLFKGLSSEQLQVIEDVMRVGNYKKGDHIIVEGEEGDEMYVLLKGSIEISARMTLSNGSSGSRDKSLKQLHDNYNIFFGEMSMFGKEQRSATVSAITDCYLGILTKEQVDTLSKNDPSLGYHLFRNMGEKIATTLRWANRDILKLTTAFVLALEGK
ncbi:cyclic nucleotide-binding domain-containing protein [bacterium]|nr:cyclic nucleotide-binding domain-containing protein [bacterium]